MPKNKKKFTLATITLNNAEGLEKTWNSIKSQEFEDFEWLIQDGGSTDDTINILKNTLGIIQCMNDTGIYNAMNRLISRASGEYILFLNAGDMLADPQTLKTIAQNIKNQADFIYGDALEQAQDGKINYKPSRKHKRITLGMFTHHQAMLYKTSAIGKKRYNEDYKITADYDFTARILKSAKNIEYIPTPICIFEAGGISQQETKAGRNEQFQIRKTLKLCSPIQNVIITTLQAINMAFRTFAPNLYWSLKQR